MLDNNTIDLAMSKKYTEFSDAIKSELKSKLSNNDYVKKYTSDFDKIDQMKSMFAKIHKSPEE